MHGLARYHEMKKKPNLALFIVSQVLQMPKEVNNIRYSSHFGCNFPVRCNVFVSDVGQTSYSITAEMYDDKNRTILMRGVTKVVVVDSSTRKPMQIREEYFSGIDNHYKSFSRITIDKKKQQKIPENVFRHTVKALHSDCDYNNHVNQASYVRWASDAASLAAVEKHLKNFTRHIELYSCESFETHYIGEAVAGEELLVIVWESETNSKELHVAIQRKGIVIFTMDLEFRDSPVLEVAAHINSQL